MTLKRPPLLLDPVRPNEGIGARYQARLDALVDDMAASVLYWIRAQYRASPPVLATDAIPAAELTRQIATLGKRWQGKFDKLAPKLANYFAQNVANRSDKALAGMLRTGGFTVKYTQSAAQKDALKAIVEENVSLIKSIPEQYLKNVTGSVMRSVQTGRDLSTLARELTDTHGVTKRRAAFIARDQNNKATAALTRVRQRELGITKAVWVHSGGGKHPRPEHVAFSGKQYDVEKGAYLEDKWTWPGVEPNCQCVSKSVVPGF